MGRAEKIVDIDEVTDVAALAEEVQSSGEPAVLQRKGKAIARLVPVEPKKSKRPKAENGMPYDDPFWNLVGIGSSGGSDIAEHKHEYIADAIESHWKE